MTGLCDSEGRTRFTLPSLPFEPMPSAVRERIRSDRATWAARAAGTVKPEGVAVDQVAVEQVGLDADAAPYYGDGVQ